MAAALRQGAGELLHHRGLARAAHGQVADHDHEAAERLVVEQPLAGRARAGAARGR